jgi:hypothetical protein
MIYINMQDSFRESSEQQYSRLLIKMYLYKNTEFQVHFSMITENQLALTNRWRYFKLFLKNLKASITTSKGKLFSQDINRVVNNM